MNTSFWFQASKSKIVTIALCVGDSSCWGVSVNGRLLSGSYGSPEEAAFFANRKDFGGELVVELFSGVSVPSDIRIWRPGQPPEPQTPAVNNQPRDCRNRHRRLGSINL